MKKTIIKPAAFLLMLLLLLLSSCHAGETGKTPEHDDAFRVSLSLLDATVKTESGVVLMNGSVQLPTVFPEDRYAVRNEALRAAATAILKDAKKQADNRKEWAEDADFRPASCLGICEVKRAGEDGWLSVLFTTEMDLGGFHSVTGWKAVTFAPGKDEPLTLAGLLGMTEEETGDYLVQAFGAQIEAHPEQYFDDALTLLPSLAEKVGFYVTEKDELTLFFEPYEITPYAAGLTSVTLPLPEGAGR